MAAITEHPKLGRIWAARAAMFAVCAQLGVGCRRIVELDC
jgi:hypothetical protein